MMTFTFKIVFNNLILSIVSLTERRDIQRTVPTPFPNYVYLHNKVDRKLLLEVGSISDECIHTCCEIECSESWLAFGHTECPIYVYFFFPFLMITIIQKLTL